MFLFDPEPIQLSQSRGYGQCTVANCIKLSRFTHEGRHPPDPLLGEAPDRFFGQPAMGIPQWLAARLILAGDIETNLGQPKPTASLPTTTWTCHLCNKHITSRHFSYRCNTAPIHWVHKT